MSTTELEYALAHNKVRLYPNKTTQAWFLLNVSYSRFVYNFFLDVQKEWYKQLEPKKHAEFEKSMLVVKSNPMKLTKEQKITRERNEKAVRKLVSLHKKTGKRNMSYFDMAKLLTSLKNMKGFEWLRAGHAQAMQQSLKDLSGAFVNFYAGRSKYPCYHKRGSRDSFKFPGNTSVEIDTLREGVRLPGGSTNERWVNCGGLRSELLKNYITIQSVTVSLDAGNWYASILARVPVDKSKFTFSHKVCGVDVGVAQPVTVSYEDGTHVVFGKEFSERLSVKELRVKHYQRQMSRRKSGSKNWNKSKVRLQTAHQRVRFARHDFVEQTSHVLAQTKVVCFEDTKLSNMTRSARGTLEKPGKNVRAKSCLNRVLLRLGLGKLKTRTEQKLTKRKGTFIAVPAPHTSQTCHVCGYVSKLNRKSQAVFECQSCGHAQNADDNASDNMRLLGTGKLKPWRKKRKLNVKKSKSALKSKVSADRRRKPAKILPLGGVRRKLVPYV